MNLSQQSVHSSTSHVHDIRRRSSVSSNPNEAVFSQRIVFTDFYTSFPIPTLDLLYSEFRGTEIRRVPVIRIFGATPKGQKTCTHIHGVFPYLYIPYDTTLENIEHRLAFALDKSINSTINWKSNGAQHVYKILKVTGRPFYGFKTQDSIFLKIYFYSPFSLKKGEELLQSGTILGKQFQPYESHIPFILQFFMDFKLYGMNFINFREIKFRRKIEQLSNTTFNDSRGRHSAASNPGVSNGVLSQALWDFSEIPEELFLSANVDRRSRCDLEIDVMASDIIVSQSSRGKNPGIEAIWMDEKERRRLHQIEDWANLTIPNSQDRGALSFVFPREKELLDQLQARLQFMRSPTNEMEVTPLELDSFWAPVTSFQASPKVHLQSLSPPPASQTYLDDCDVSSLPSASNNFGNEQAHIALNEEDEEIIAMMEDMARNRIEENDSIIATQVAAGQEDEEDYDEEDEGIPEIGEHPCEIFEQDSDEELKTLSQEYLTPAMLADLEQWEKKYMEENETVNSDVSKQKNIKPFSVDQCDGQYDESSSNSSGHSKSSHGSRLCKKRLKIELEREDAKTRNPKYCTSPFDKLSSSSSVLSLKFRKEKSRQRRAQKDLEHKSKSSSSFKSFITTSTCATSSSVEVPPLKFDSILVANSNTEDSEVIVLKLDSREVPIEVVSLGSSGSDEYEELVNIKEKGQGSSEQEVIVIDAQSSEESSTASENEFMDNSGCTGKEEKRISNKVSEFHHSDSPGTIQARSACVLELKNPSNLQDLQHNDSSEEDVEFAPDLSLGITSFYEYSQSQSATEDNESEIAELPMESHVVHEEEKWINSVYEYSDDFANEEASCKSSASSIKSFYEYSSESQHISTPSSNSDSEEISPGNINTSFNDICFDYTQPSDIASDSSENEANCSQSTKNSEFRRKMNKFNMERRAKIEREDAEREKLKPSNFFCTTKPLKIIQLSQGIAGWFKNREKQKNKSDMLNIDDEPKLSSVSYMRLIEESPSLANQTRKSMIRDLRSKPNIIEVLENNPYPKTREAILPDSDDSTDDESELNRIVRPFRFVGGTGNDDESGLSDSGSASNFDLSDNETNTVVPSPVASATQLLTPSPLPPSVFPSVTKKNSSSTSIDTRTAEVLLKKSREQLISRVTPRRKSKLSTNSTSDLASLEPVLKSQSSLINPGLMLPKFRPNDSELDSPSSRISNFEKVEDFEDWDASNFQNAKAFHEHQYLSTLVMEVHCASRGDLIPDPEHDEILGIFYGLHNDSADSQHPENVEFGYLLVAQPNSEEILGINSMPIQYFCDEVSMLRKFILLIQGFDPDILIGYEIQKFSWGYFIERGCKLGLNILQDLSRLVPLPYQEKAQSQHLLDVWNESVSGRIVLNLWKLLRHEITTTSYTFENAVFHLLHERVHLLSYKVLGSYWNSSLETRMKVIQYFRRRVEYTMRIIQKLDLINRTSELARLFGIQFFEVLSRGSQFRVESMMLRLAKPVNLIPPSPNPQQRAKMKAPEYLPLIMEPESKFYTDPVAVLDFQSLYPSMMMAYNYCFSTCIGRVHQLGQEDVFDLGCLNQQISSSELASLFAENLLHISPCGVVFVKHKVKRGILGNMLEQILDTRQMVKRAMKKWKEDETLQRVLDSRQLGLKLIANVTYGYTSANYSGRMPCIEIADSVVSKGRETLQRAIDYVKENEDIFGGKVVYGDTDSLFIHFPGKTRAEAFVSSQRIVDDITALNPKPVKLKLEKVYQPCILQTKKRYVGFSYETPDQREPKYDAKGIETVRRDGCPATAKILEGTLKILFSTKDSLLVKNFIVEQFRKIFRGRVSLSKYTFARAYRGRMGYKPGACVASLEIAKKLAEKDPRAEPLTKERVPYIVVYGTPGSTLISRVRRPEEFIGNPNLRLHSHYYIEKAIIPALNRCLALAKLDVFKWYNEMPRRYLKTHYTETEARKKGTIDQYFVRENCVKCDCWTQTGFCDQCFPNLDDLKVFLRKRKSDIVRKYESCMKTCRNCSGETEMICINMNCSIKHKFLRYERDYLTKLPATIKLRSRVFGENDLDW